VSAPLFEKVDAWASEKERTLLTSVAGTITLLMEAWVQLVVDSAEKARPSPKWQIVADGRFIGWRVWRALAGSTARIKPRIAAFRKVVALAAAARLPK
jgi:hypothetical protein